MSEYGPETFGLLNAEHYDERHDPGTTGAAVAFLAALSPGGSALEFAIGTGRIALPLAARGLRLAGIEASPLMVEKMRAKPGGADIPVVIGDMATAKMEGRFDLVFLIFNTLFNLTTRTAQQDCFCNAAAHLNPGGLFVIETVMPDTAEFVHGQRLRIRKRTKDCQVLEAAIHDPDNQRIDYQYIRMEGEGVEITPLPIRYASPQEIDEMAASAGFALTQRWGGWRRAPFASESDMHISVYRTA